MSNWQEKIAPLVLAVEKRYDAVKYWLRYKVMGGPGPIQIQPYRGYGTPEKLYLQGRVLEKQGIQPPSEVDNWWDNLVNMVKRLQSWEVPHSRVRARFQGMEQVLTANEEGMFELWMEPAEPVAEGGWESIELELIEPLSDRQEGPVRATGEVYVAPGSAPYGVISDIDDTLLQSDVGHTIRMMRTLLLGNARTRLPLPGAAALYRALHAGPQGNGRTPLFYVSNGLWNLYDLLEDFFAWNEIPGGPILLLRNWGVYHDEILPFRQRQHKLAVTRQILDLYADLPFILIGDSGEADPEVYAELVHQYGDRILAVYIRKVRRDPRRAAALRTLAEEVAAAGSELVLADDSLGMAEHASGRGYISDTMLSEIRAEQMRTALAERAE